MRRLPGAPVAVDRLRDLPRLAVTWSWLMGPGAWSVLLSSRHRHRAERRFARWAVGLAGIDLTIRGLEHIEGGQPYVIASLHEGLADVVALLHLPVPMRFVAREELLGWPVLGRYLRSSGQAIVSPERPESALATLLEVGSAATAAGESLAVFPQGTLLGVETAFQRGAFWLADRLGVPVLPVVVTGSHRVWEHPFTPRVRFGQPIDVRVLEPLPVGEAEARMDDVERTMKDLALAGPTPPRRFDPERDGWWDDYRYAIDPAFTELAARHARRVAGAG